MRWPWDDVIPAADRAAFERGELAGARTIDVGVRPALIVVDMTVEFVDSTYPTGWSETGYPAAECLSRLLSVARSAGLPVFFTKGWPTSAPPTTPGELGLWKHGSGDTVADSSPHSGDVIVPQLAPASGEVVINKGSKPSAFFGTPLASLLTYLRVDTTIVTGMTTSGCVRATAVDAFQHNYRVLIPHECCADRSQVSHKVSPFDLHMKYADVVSLDSLLETLSDSKR
jgi:nicotinamidase-related amidase